MNQQQYDIYNHCFAYFKGNVAHCLAKESPDFYKNWFPMLLDCFGGAIYEGAYDYQSSVYAHKTQYMLMFKEEKISHDLHRYPDEDIVWKKTPIQGHRHLKNIKYLVNPSWLEKKWQKIQEKKKDDIYYAMHPTESTLRQLKPFLRLFYGLGSNEEIIELFNQKICICLPDQKYQMDWVIEKIKSESLLSIPDLEKIVSILNGNYMKIMTRSAKDPEKEKYHYTYVCFYGYYIDRIEEIIRERRESYKI